MRDLHFDGGFMREFSAATEQWSWATWHQVRAAQESTAARLLEEVFGPADGNTDQPEESADK